MKRNIILITLVILFGIISGYLFFWPSDLQITFKTKAIPGVVNQSIKLWANGLENSKFISQKNQENFSHQFKFNDSIYTFDWEISALNDSVSKVKVLINDQDHSIRNRLTVPLYHTNFEKRMESTVQDLMEILKDHTEGFEVSLAGMDSIPKMYCAYIPFKCKQTDKALKMMKSYTMVSSVLLQNNISIVGLPFNEIEEWQRDKDSISFNFCFPIKKSDTLPDLNGIKYKYITKKKAIKAVYKGNYITSDRAWYSLLKYADENGLIVAENPIEFFHSNPNMGGNEKDWKAEVYLPIKQ